MRRETRWTPLLALLLLAVRSGGGGVSNVGEAIGVVGVCSCVITTSSAAGLVVPSPGGVLIPLRAVAAIDLCVCMSGALSFSACGAVVLDVVVSVVVVVVWEGASVVVAVVLSPLVPLLPMLRPSLSASASEGSVVCCCVLGCCGCVGRFCCDLRSSRPSASVLT